MMNWDSSGSLKTDKMITLKRLFTTDEGERTSPFVFAINTLIVCSVLTFLIWLALSAVGIRLSFAFLADYKVWIWRGFKTTVAVSFFSLILSLAIGVLVAAGESSRIIPVRYACKGYVAVIRGTPLITQIYLFFYIFGTAMQIGSRFISGVLILSVFEGAYIAEIIRGSYISIDKTQLEAARSVGFDRMQELRYVIIPQMVARTVPALAGQFATIIKDSSLLSVIALFELQQAFKQISTTTYSLFESYFTLGIIYLCLTLPITFVSKLLEKRFYYEN